ncbi:MAG: PEP-CTERM sorting domain-containing protein [Gemmatimonas sp.]|nr:PEP-CTERM sorting domain-containing protein [Gemmatimonas sp.]
MRLYFPSSPRHLAITGLAALLSLAPQARAQDINGGSSWSGWNLVGRSDQLGVYGAGSTATVYKVYRTLFSFMNNGVSGSPTGGGPTGGATGFGTGTFSSGAFANGNTVLGIGIECVGPCTLSKPTIKFDLDNDSYAAASSVGGSDGRVNFSQWSKFRDFTVQFEPTDAWRGGILTMQAGVGAGYVGTSNPQQIVGSNGSGVSYDWPFRAFAQSGSYQMFFDLNAMQTLYGVGSPNPSGKNVNFTGIGAFGPSTGFALNGVGDNQVVFSAPTQLNVVPEPASLALVGAGMVGFALAAQRRRRRA